VAQEGQTQQPTPSRSEQSTGDPTTSSSQRAGLHALAARGRSALRKTSNTAARIVAWAATLAALLIVLGIVFTIFNANPTNGIVARLMSIDRTLLHPFGEMFTPQNPQTKVLVNWGIGAAVYVLAGQLVARLLGR
jgi:hypothetical protein